MGKSKSMQWCCGLRDGLRVVEPNERLAQSYLREARGSLERAEKNLKDKDLLWATVVIYYAEYYALYAFLQKIGIKCENHFCSILAVGFLLGEEKVHTINTHKDKRIDAQYYMRVDKEEEVEKMLQEAKLFVTVFDAYVATITDAEASLYRKKIEEIALRKSKTTKKQVKKEDDRALQSLRREVPADSG
jgi:uncharacterized protein (UPF0332 family)